MTAPIGSVNAGARFVGGRAVNLQPAPSPCWCGTAVCWDHGRYCDRCGWNRARAMLRYVKLSPAQSIMQCIDACEGRGNQYDV